jgi:hypothetical protein
VVAGWAVPRIWRPPADGPLYFSAFAERKKAPAPGPGQRLLMLPTLPGDSHRGRAGADVRIAQSPATPKRHSGHQPPLRASSHVGG